MVRGDYYDEELIKNRVFNVRRNTVLGFVSIGVSIIFPMLIRMIMLHTLSSQYLGLNNLFQSIMTVLNTLELGIGTAMVFFLYEPVACGNREKVGAYLLLLRKMYSIVGIIVSLLGMIIMPILPLFISDDVPSDVNIYFCFLLYLIGSILGYFIYPEQVILASAYQRSDINSKVLVITGVVTYALQIVTLFFFQDYVVYLVLIIFQGIFVGCMRKKYHDRFFPYIYVRGKLSINEQQNVKKSIFSMIGHQLDERLLNGIDSVFISTFCGLEELARYGNYYFVVSGLTMLFITFFNAMLAVIGNMVVTEDRISNYERFKKIFFLNAIATGWASLCMLSLYQDFMSIWMGDLLLDDKHMVLFVVYFYFAEMRMTVLTFKNAAGMWKNDMLRPYVSIGVDILLNILLISKLGIIGAMLSSIVCILVVSTPWETRVLFRDYFKMSIREYVFQYIGYLIVNFVIAVGIYGFFKRLMVVECVWLGMILKLAIGTVSYFVIISAIFYKNKGFIAWKNELKGMIFRNS